jgi:hypothetical protein
MNPLERASGDTSACLRWLHVNVVLSRGVSLSEEQLRQLSHAVGDDAVRSSIEMVSRPRAHVDAQRVTVCVDDRRWRTRRWSWLR